MGLFDGVAVWFSAFVDTVVGLASGVGEGIVNIGQGIGDVLSDFADGLGNLFGGLSEGISSFVGSVGEGFEGFISAVGGAFGGLVNAVSGFFNMLAMFGYLICGAVIVFIVLIIFLVYSFVKDKKYRRDMMMIQAETTRQLGYARDVEVSRSGTTAEGLKRIPL